MVCIREPKVSDAEPLLGLMDQWGYSMDAKVMKRICSKFSGLSNQKAWVAEKESALIGCIAACSDAVFFTKRAPFCASLP